MKESIQQKNSKKEILTDVVVMRLVLIVMLIFYHAFAPFCGNWEILSETYSNETYFWIGKFSLSFFLEAFVFISGLVAGFQAMTKPINHQGAEYVIKKFKRLFIPSMVFSVLYFLLFYEWGGCYPLLIK